MAASSFVPTKSTLITLYQNYMDYLPHINRSIISVTKNAQGEFHGSLFKKVPKKKDDNHFALDIKSEKLTL
jgi:hypothetical protein